MLSHRKGVLLDGIGSELVRASTGGVRKTLSKWLGDLSNAINLGDVASTFTSGDATPSVLDNSKFITAGTTAITNFTNGVEGQTITIYRGASDIAITDNANIDPIIAGDITLSAARPSATFRLASGVWKQVEEAGASATTFLPVQQAATLAASRTALAAAGLADANIFTNALNTFRGRVFCDPAYVAYDSFANVEGSMLTAGAAALTVATNKEYDFLRADNSFTIGAGGIATLACINYTLSSGSDSTANLYGLLFGVTNNSSGTASPINCRGIGGTGNGPVFGGKFGLTPGASTTIAVAVQASLTTTARKGDYGFWLVESNNGSASVDYAFLVADGVATGQAVLCSNTDGAGDFLRENNAAGNAVIYKVDSAGAQTSTGNTVNGNEVVTGTIDVGHATQNTLSGSGGNLFVEGNLLYRAGGTDVPIADGGTNASTDRGACANLKTWYVLAASGVSISHTGSTSETTQATITIPAGAIGPNGAVRITVQTRFTTVTASNKTFRIKLDGTSILENIAGGASISGRFQTQFHNRNSASSQIANSITQVNFTANTAAIVTSSIDTSIAKDITLTAQLADGSDTLYIESYLVELLYQA